MAERTCSIDGCGTQHYARDWCSKHYQRWKATGDPVSPPRPKGPPPVAGCGTVAAYTRGCRCDDCRAASRDRKRRYREEHADTHRAYRAATESTEEYRLRMAARKKADREANPDKYRRRLADYNATEAGRQNRHLRKLRRRAREFDAEMCVVTAADWQRLLDQYRHCCAYCGASDRPLTREHIIPLARGGRHSIGNLLPVCGSCNYSKADRLLVEWRAWKQAIAAAS